MENNTIVSASWYERCTLMIILSFLLLFTGCATQGSVKYDPIINNKTFQPRQVPAKITRAETKTLEDMGYYMIGRISAFYPANAGEEKTAYGKLNEMLLNEAARQGGDVIRLTVVNQPQNEEKAIKDKCLYEDKRNTCTYENVPYQECPGGTISHCVTKYRLQNVCRNVSECKQWSYTTKIIYGRMSSGTVWRYDPAIKENKSIKYR